MSNHDQLSQAAKRKCDCFFYVDVHGQIAYVSEYCCTYLGYGREELIARAVADIDVLDDGDRFMDMVALRMRGQPSIFEAKVRRSDGAMVPVVVNITHAPYGSRMLLKCELRDMAMDREAGHAQSKGEAMTYALASR